MSDLSVSKTRNGYWAVFRKDKGRISRTYFSRSEAEQALSGFGTRGAAVRKCMACGADFDSNNVGERLCQQHRNDRISVLSTDWSPNKGKAYA